MNPKGLIIFIYANYSKKSRIFTTKKGEYFKRKKLSYLVTLIA
jgi:hypothetical protein